MSDSVSETTMPVYITECPQCTKGTMVIICSGEASVLKECNNCNFQIETYVCKKNDI